jgi:hypothetical protein
MGDAVRFPNTNLAVSSIEYCGCLFDERDVSTSLSSCGRHDPMIPLLSAGI